MFEESFRGLADLVLPGTSYLERDGTTVNLEGRLQRQRRAVIAPVPGRARLDREARRALRRRALAARLARLRGGLGDAATAASRSAQIGEHAAAARPPVTVQPAVANPPAKPPRRRQGPAPRLTYRPLFSGPAVERTPELEFQRPRAARSSSRAPTRAHAEDRDRRRRSRSARTARRSPLRARIARDLPAGTVRVPRADAEGLHEHVEVSEVTPSRPSPGGSR